MNFKNRIITALGGIPKQTNSVRGNDFLKYGPREVLSADWKEIKFDDQDVYRGYPYAVIQKRANKVASLAKQNVVTWAKPDVVDLWQQHDQDPIHPYLTLIEDSTDFSVKQFWKTICIYLDLAGAYYLGVVRKRIESKNPDKFPDIYGDVQKFIMLNPYEIKRVVDKNGKVAGYVETKKDGRQREWPAYMIIPMRELNPFDFDKVWSMTDAAKEATFTLSQSGNYTRETLNGNLNAPGIVSTDVILEDNQFADFANRVRNHTKGEPIFGNGAGAITWTSMQQDLDKAALLDINEINRTTLFAVSGTSKTSLGIEQSGTTRETARVQTEQFISDTAQPRLEDILDFLNLDYKRYYMKEYQETGYWLEIKSAASRDYSTEIQATQMRQAQSDLALGLMQRGYTTQSCYDYAEGKIELSDLELEKGLDKPENPEEDNTPPENTPSDAPESPTSDDRPQDDNTTIQTEEVAQNASEPTNTALIEREGLVPHSQLKVNSSEEVHDHRHCECGKVETLINELGELEGKTLEESYKKFLNDIEEIQKETYKACLSKLTLNAFDEDDIIGKQKKKSLTNKLREVIQNYWWILTPLLANSVLDDRNKEYGENVKFVFTNAIQTKVEDNAIRVADGHMKTILNDLLSAANKAYTNVMEEKAAELIVKAYKENEAKYTKYFEEQPSMTEALKAIRNTDILEENRKIYERANELAIQGYKREDIIKKIREEYNHVSKERAELIAQNETSRAYAHSQYEADTQFLNSIGQLETAMKRMVSMRPENEQDKICPLCRYLIDLGPIPFTENFLSLGDTVSIDNDGKMFNFVCNYEDIQGGCNHPRCLCRYELILNGKTLNDATTNGDNPSDSGDSGDDNNQFDKSSKTVNGGKGSGNFGHAGRPGKVGGSASDSTIASPETKVTADWLDKHREFAKAKGFTDEWIDQSVKDLKRRELKEKGIKARTTKQFDKVWEAMQKEGQDYSVWYETVGKAHREHLAKLEELRAGFDKEAQSKAVKELEDTGIILRNSDKKWLEEQCPAELINGVKDSLKEAEQNGLNLKETQVQFTPATKKGGSCTFDPVNNEVVIRLTRDWLVDTKASESRARTKGPDGSKWWTNGKINTASTHECGHAMVWQVIKNQNLTPYAYERYCEKIVSQANDIFASQSGEDYWKVRGELSRNEDKKYISSYGSKNAMETIAESYNNPNYSAYTKIVNDLVKDGLAGKTKWTV